MYDEIKRKEETVKAIIRKSLIVKYKWMCGFACVVIGLIACHPRTERPALNRAAAWMDTNPDSAQLLLEAIPQPERLSQEEYATWCLLVTQARDKNYVVHTSDSVIDVAVRYFAERNEPVLLAQSLYYQGKVYLKLDQLEKATYSFIKALDIAEDNSDCRLLYEISSQLGLLYIQLGFTDKAYDMCKRVCGYANRLNEDSVLSYACSYLGEVYGMDRNWKQAERCFIKAIDHAQKGKNVTAEIYALQSYGAICLEANWQEKLQNCIDKIKKKKDAGDFSTKYNLEEFYCKMGEVCQKLGRMKQSISFLEKALRSSDIHILAKATLSLAKVNESLGNHRAATACYNKYLTYEKTIRKEENSQALITMNEKYNYEKLAKESAQSDLQNSRLINWAFIVICVLGIIIFAVVKVYRSQLDAKEKIVATIHEQLMVWIEKSSASEKEKSNIQKLLDDNSEKIVSLEKSLSDLQKKNTAINALYNIANKKISTLEEQKLHVVEKEYVPILFKMQRETFYLKEKDWDELYVLLDLLFNQFVKRLSNQYPQLKIKDIKLCCLLKLGYSNSEIAEFLSVQEDAIIKRKQRLTNKIGYNQSWKNGEIKDYMKNF